MDIRLDGRSALITGASLGIGRAIGTRLAEAGANVALVARRADVLEEAQTTLQRTAKGRVIAICADVSTVAGCESAFAEAVEAFDTIDILVNNAGTSRRGAFESIDDATWQADLDLKLFAAIRLCRLALPVMKAQRWGRVINVLAIGAKAPQATSTPTSVSRAAGLALTKVLAGEYTPHNVLVNALLVGKIRSNQWEKRAVAGNRDIEELYADVGGQIPLGRVGLAEEFANAACFLASDAASYISGTAVNVDGGASPVV